MYNEQPIHKIQLNISTDRNDKLRFFSFRAVVLMELILGDFWHIEDGIDDGKNYPILFSLFFSFLFFFFNAKQSTNIWTDTLFGTFFSFAFFSLKHLEFENAFQMLTNEVEFCAMNKLTNINEYKQTKLGSKKELGIFHEMLLRNKDKTWIWIYNRWTKYVCVIKIFPTKLKWMNEWKEGRQKNNNFVLVHTVLTKYTSQHKTPDDDEPKQKDFFLSRFFALCSKIWFISLFVSCVRYSVFSLNLLLYYLICVQFTLRQTENR